MRCRLPSTARWENCTLFWKRLRRRRLSIRETSNPSTSLLYERLSDTGFQDCPLRPLGPADHKHTRRLLLYPYFRRRKSPEATEGGLPLGSPPTVKSVLETGEPVISDLFMGLVSKRPSLATTVPVIRDGNIAYGLSMVTLPANFATLLREQGLPHEWNAVIVDRNGTIISRNPDAERFVGRPVSPKLRGLLSQSDRERQPDCGRVQLYSAFARSTLTGWAIAGPAGCN